MPKSPDSLSHPSPPALALHDAGSADAFSRMFREHESLLGPGPDLAPRHREGAFTVPGFCWIDQAHVEFAMDGLYSENREGVTLLNWRERMVCPKCGLNNRVRGAVHVFEITSAAPPSASLWLTEQLSPLYATLKARYPHTIGSEFLGDHATPGSVNVRGVRHESLTRPSFAPASLDAILSFDVFEHIPDVDAAFRQCARVLKPSGQLLFSVPFLPLDNVTRLRAEVAADGSIRHLLPPVYHGDPVNPRGGILCYREFGWDILDQLRVAGFSQVRCVWYASSSYGYVGGPFQLFIAIK